MSNELQKSLAERAKEFLQLEGEHSFFELAEFLREARNATHPDKFQSQDLKEKAEARFKSAQALLDEFQRQMELDRFNLKPSELAIYKPFYDAVQLQSELDKTKKELEDTKYELKSEREVNSDLNKQLATKQDESLRAEIQHLQSIYKPSTRKYASIGLAIVLSGALAVMTQMEKVSGILEKYSLFGKQYISLGLFVCLVFFLVAMLRKMWEREYIKRKSEEVCARQNMPTSSWRTSSPEDHRMQRFLSFRKLRCSILSPDVIIGLRRFLAWWDFRFLDRRRSTD